jgi:hypothetical protein
MWLFYYFLCPDKLDIQLDTKDDTRKSSIMAFVPVLEDSISLYTQIGFLAEWRGWKLTTFETVNFLITVTSLIFVFTSGVLKLRKGKRLQDARVAAAALQLAEGAPQAYPTGRYPPAAAPQQPYWGSVPGEAMQQTSYNPSGWPHRAAGFTTMAVTNFQDLAADMAVPPAYRAAAS